ncbi:CHASE2 domain-containing protein [Spirochaetota bacterium]
MEIKKLITSMIVGVVIAIVIWIIAYNTILFDAMERALGDGFFFMREPDAKELASGKNNRYVSDAVQLISIDDQSLGSLGKWPWYRDVHAQYLKNIQQFSPSAVYFDVAFVLPERVPNFFKNKLSSDRTKLNEVTGYFKAMDDMFTREISRHDNVLLDLILVGAERPNIEYLKRIKYVERVMEKFSQPAGPADDPRYFSLEPIVENYIKYGQPVTINQWPDKDEVIRSFFITHPYQTSDGEKRNYFSVVLALLMNYYRVERDFVTIRPDSVILNYAKVPVMDKETHKPVVYYGKDFKEIRSKTTSLYKPRNYNRNMYNYIVNEYTYLTPGDDERVPMYPIHLMFVKDAETKKITGYKLIGGREVYDAAVRLRSKKVDVIFYEETSIVIKTERNFAGVPHFFPINFAGRQEIPYKDPYTDERKVHYTVPTDSYLGVYNLNKIPSIPAIANKKVEPGYNIKSLERWFKKHCEAKYNEVLIACQKKYGELSEQNVMTYITEDDPYDGRYVYYKMFIDDINALAQAGDIPRPQNIYDLVAWYSEWLGMRGFEQDKDFHLTFMNVIYSLQDFYLVYFNKYNNKIIFTGAYSTGMAHDIKVTPYGTMFGINVIISAFNTIVTDNQVTKSPNALNIPMLIVLCLIFAFVYGIMNVRINSYIFILSFIITFILSYLIFAYNNYILKTVPLVMANVLIFVAITVIKVLTEEKDKKFLKNTFAQYISPELIDIMYESKTVPKLGGQVAIITPYFTDIQAFSTFSEILTAEQLVELLNEYLTAMTDTLLAENGTLDKYEGDAIIAFFGAPMEMKDHAYRACKVAVGMQNALLDLRKKWEQETGDDARNYKKIPPEKWGPGEKWPKIVHKMRMRIGINTGEIVTGNMGSAVRMNYTMMGDSVNLAARLEAGAKQYGVYSMMSKFTYDNEYEDEEGNKKKLADQIEVRFIDKIVVVGKSEPVTVYELVALKGGLTDQEKTLFSLFDEGIKLYQDTKWDDAIKKFKEALKYERFPDGKTTPSEVYIGRCEEYKKEPPVKKGEKWDGVYRLTSK